MLRKFISAFVTIDAGMAFAPAMGNNWFCESCKSTAFQSSELAIVLLRPFVFAPIFFHPERVSFFCP
jgi:hypothetical protein